MGGVGRGEMRSAGGLGDLATCPSRALSLFLCLGHGFERGVPDNIENMGLYYGIDFLRLGAPVDGVC